MKNLIIFIPSIENAGVEKNLFIILNYLKLKIKNIHLLTFDDSKKNYFDNGIKIINPKFNFTRMNKIQFFSCFSLLIEELILAQVHRLELRHNSLVEFFGLVLEEVNFLINLCMCFSDDLFSQNDRELVQ